MFVLKLTGIQNIFQNMINCALFNSMKFKPRTKNGKMFP